MATVPDRDLEVSAHARRQRRGVRMRLPEHGGGRGDVGERGFGVGVWAKPGNTRPETKSKRSVPLSRGRFIIGPQT